MFDSYGKTYGVVSSRALSTNCLPTIIMAIWVQSSGTHPVPTAAGSQTSSLTCSAKIFNHVIGQKLDNRDGLSAYSRRPVMKRPCTNTVIMKNLTHLEGGGRQRHISIFCVQGVKFYRLDNFFDDFISFFFFCFSTSFKIISNYLRILFGFQLILRPRKCDVLLNMFLNKGVEGGNS